MGGHLGRRESSCHTASGAGRNALVLFAGLAALILGSGASAAVQKSTQHNKHKPVPAHIRAHRDLFDERYAAIVMDANSGRILHEHNADGMRYPASLTKMMTLYLTFEAMGQGRIQFSSQIPVSGEAASQTPTRLGLKAGQRLSVHDAVLGLITRSANDAAVTLAEALGGTEDHFAEMMTRKAHQLGMERTVFRNASGLPDPEQHTTARDIATLGLRLQRDFPQYYPLFATAEFHFRNQVIPNHNHLLKQYPGTDGLKTGFIHASGFNLAASARHGDSRVIGVVLGGPTSAARDRRMIELLDHGFATLQNANDVLVAVNEQPSPLQGATGGTASAQGTITTGLAAKGVVQEGDTDEEEESAPAPKSKIASVTDGHGWGIQVGAFRTQASAETQLGRVRQLLPELNDARPVIASDRGKTQRARLLGLDQDQANQACKRLKAKDMPCMTLSPGVNQAG